MIDPLEILLAIGSLPFLVAILIQFYRSFVYVSPLDAQLDEMVAASNNPTTTSREAERGLR